MKIYNTIIVLAYNIICFGAVWEEYEGFRLTYGILGEVRTLIDVPSLCLTATR